MQSLQVTFVNGYVFVQLVSLILLNTIFEPANESRTDNQPKFLWTIEKKEN
jgi:hypothetical protein